MPTKTTINFAALFLLCFLSSFNSISAQTTSGDVTLPANTFAIGPSLTAYYELDSNNGIFTMAVKCSVPGVFFGVGLGTSMTGADIWIFEIVNNAIRATDCWSTTATKPASDTSRGGVNNIVLLGYEIAPTYTLVKMQRALNTGDTNDMTIQAGSTNFIWAHGTAATAAYHGVGNRGEVVFTLVENTPPAGEEGELPIGEGEISVGEEEVIVDEEEPIVEEEEIQVDVSSGNVTLPSNMVTLSQFLEVGYELNTTDSSITMTLVCTVPNQFFGFGLGASMFGSDIWVFEIVDSAVTATDYYSTTQDFPIPDTDRGGLNNLQVLAYAINSNYTLVKVKRALNTADSNDKVITIGTNSVIFATAPSQTLAYHDTSKGTGTLTIAEPGTGSDSGSGGEEEEETTGDGDGSGSTGDAVGDVSVPANTLTLGSYLTISYEMDTNNTNITMLIKCSLPGQFFALGFGEGMLNSDVWLFQLENSEVTVGDYFSTAYDFPTSDTSNGGQNSLERLGYQITPEYTLVKIRRALVTGDPNDRDIRIGANDVIYASVNSPTVAYHSTGENGVGTITLIGNSADPEGSEENNDPGAIGDITLPDNYFYIGGLLQINFEFTSDNGIIVSFNCTEPNQFFGIGFGSVMTGTDMWIFEIVNSGTAVAATDYKSLIEGAPTMDTRLGGTQDLELLGYKITDSYTFVKVKRALDTGDPNDFILYEGWIDMIYATANTKFLSQHSSSQRGFVVVPFIDGTRGYYVTDETDNTDEIHGILNLLAWGLLVDIGIIAVRILRGRKFTFGNVVISAQLIHSAIMWLVFIMSITVSAMSLNKDRSTRGAKLTGLPKNDFHFINGVIMMFLSFLTVVIGVASMLYLKSYKQAPPTLVNIKKLHRWLGYIMYLGAKANIIVGVLIYKDGVWKAPVLVYLGALVVLHMFIQKKYADGFKFSKKIRNITQKPSRKPRHVALMSALNNGVPRERLLLDFPHIKWVQLGNKVYDVTDWTHPGGNFIIQACIGREVGRFIYGNYALESTNYKPHKHSPLALSQLNHFYIGEVTNYESVLVSKNSSQEVVSRVTNEWTIASIRPLSDTVSQVNFESKEIRVKNFGTSLTWLARHFTVGFANRKKPFRLYTIAMSLNEANTNLRRNLFQYFDDIMSGIPSNFEYDPEYLEPQDTLPIFIKNYSNVNGLSRAIHQASYLEEDCTFRIEGPISRGLELSQASSGTQTIICGGTGLFPFIDFLNFFLWKNMYELVKKRAGKAKAQEMNILNIPFENYMNGLKLNFFGSFANERDILGLDIISKLAEISDKYELNNFNCMIKGYANDYIIGLRESFNIEFLRKHVSLDEERFYVVGPPRMNSQVPDALKKLGVSEDRIVLV